MIALLAALLAAATPAELAAQLKIDLTKTDRAIGITEQQIAKSRSAPYQPELQFRLAELYVERSRYLYLLQQTESGGKADASQVAPDVRLAKQKALSVYQGILRDFPDWPGCDRVRFYMAHEYRELGEFERMVAMEEELAARHPNSPLAGEGLLIVGDHWFAAKDLGKAEAAYQRVLAMPPQPVRDLAAFKMGWVRFNQGKHDGAVKFFEEAASSPLLDGASSDVLNVKREALFDLVFSFTESRPSKGAVEYFEKLAPSSAIYAGVLDKLANRYFIKQEWQPALLAYRKLVQLQKDPSRALDTIGRLHETIKAGGAETLPAADDARAAVRVAARVRTDERMSAAERKAALDELEVTTRDLATRILIAARKKSPADKAAYAEAAEACTAWLSLYRGSPHHAEMQRNEADSLYAAERWHEAGRAYERAYALAPENKEKEEALYNALAAHARAGRDLAQLTPWQRADALRAMALLGAQYVARYPQSARVASVKFNVARAAYDEGQFQRAAQLFTAFVSEHPAASDARPAALLVLDALHGLSDYEGMEAAGKQLAAVDKLDPAIKAEVRDTIARARGEQLSAVALQSSARSGDAAKGLIELADKQKGSELGEKALHAAFTTYRDGKDLQHANEVASKFLAAYPKSPLAVDILTTQAHLATERADFDAAAGAYEQLFARFPGETIGQDAAQTAAALRGLLGDHRREIAALEALPVARRQGLVGKKLAQARLDAGDAAGAVAMSAALLKADQSDADAAAIYCKALLAQNRAGDAGRAARNAIKAARRRADAPAIAALWDLAGESSLRLLLSAPPDPLENQVALLKQVQEASSAVAQLRAGELAVQGVYRLAVAFDALARTLAAAPAPPNLSAEDQQRYQQALQGQANDLRGQAQQAFQSCAQKANEVDVFAPYVLACAKGERLQGERGQAGASAQPASSAAIDAARARLGKRAADAEALEALGVAQLQAGDVRRARLSLQRSVQVDDARASAHAALGVALARLYDEPGARDEYKRALELDPTSDRALAGLASLRCSFGNAEGAQPLLSRMRGKVESDLGLNGCAGGKP